MTTTPMPADDINLVILFKSGQTLRFWVTEWKWDGVLRLLTYTQRSTAKVRPIWVNLASDAIDAIWEER